MNLSLLSFIFLCNSDSSLSKLLGFLKRLLAGLAAGMGGFLATGADVSMEFWNFSVNVGRLFPSCVGGVSVRGGDDEGSGGGGVSRPRSSARIEFLREGGGSDGGGGGGGVSQPDSPATGGRGGGTGGASGGMGGASGGKGGASGSMGGAVGGASGDPCCTARIEGGGSASGNGGRSDS